MTKKKLFEEWQNVRLLLVIVVASCSFHTYFDSDEKCTRLSSWNFRTPPKNECDDAVFGICVCIRTRNAYSCLNFSRRCALSSAAFQTVVIFGCLSPLTCPISFPSLHYADRLMLFDRMCYLQAPAAVLLCYRCISGHFTTLLPATMKLRGNDDTAVWSKDASRPYTTYSMCSIPQVYLC